MGYELVAGDTGSKLTATVRNNKDKALVNLTGATVQLRWKIDGGLLVTKEMTVLDQGTNEGQAEYQWAAGELTAGQLVADVRVTDSGGKVLTSLAPIFLPVRAPLT